MRILDELYFGGLSAWERRYLKDPDYMEVSKKISKIKQHFEDVLSPEENERFENLQKLLSESGLFEEIQLFEYAFSMGVLMMMDVFDFKETTMIR